MDKVQFNSLSKENLIEKIKESSNPEKKLILLDFNKNEIKDIDRIILAENTNTYDRDIFIETTKETYYKVLDLNDETFVTVEKLKGFSEAINISTVYSLVLKEL